MPESLKKMAVYTEDSIMCVSGKLCKEAHAQLCINTYPAIFSEISNLVQ